VHTWWRWVLRGLAVVALVVGSAFLTLRPLPSAAFPLRESRDIVTATCLSPFQQIQGRTLADSVAPRLGSPITRSATTGDVSEWSRNEVARCTQAASGREHIVEALGAGAVVLVGMSFLRRQRPVVTVPVNPSVL
jgi:hypothetical protein